MDMDRQKELYREEAYELLDGLEESLMELEKNPKDLDVVGRVFRAMHTIKGSGAMFGFNDIASFTHTIEAVYDLVRDGKITVDQHLISLTPASCDVIREMLDASRDGTTPSVEKATLLTSAFMGYLPDSSEADTDRQAGSQPGIERQQVGDLVERTWRIRFKPHRNIFSNGTNPALLLRELGSLGTCSIVSHLEDLPDLSLMDPESCYVWWDVVLTTTADYNAIRDVFIFVEDLCELTIEVIDAPGETDDENPLYKRIGEILLERGDITTEAVMEALRSQKRLGEILVETKAIHPSAVQAALVEQEQVRAARRKRMAGDDTTSVRVPSAKLDALVNLVGELVTVQARLSQISSRRNEAELIGVAEEVERLSSELRDITMGIRMLPIGTSFAKFRRLVRDLSTELGKETRFVMEGEETELDKTIIDKLSEPLVHLIRNSMDHGIEPPGTREQNEKARAGTIKLSAIHSGAYVFISVSDDGRGLDAEAIRAKALAKGIIAPDQALSEKELYSLIFEPGFSTVTEVSSVSGRGVGMDVVRSTVDSLGGTVEVESMPGRGTTVTLKLPLTLAIIDGLLVRIDEESYILPLSVVVECVEITRHDQESIPGRHLVKVRNEIIPYIPLRKTFRLDSTPPDIEQVVITEIAGKRVGFVVDKVIGQHQTVIKSMGSMLKRIEGISGATILGDGTVALIIDVNKIVHHDEHVANALGTHEAMTTVTRPVHGPVSSRI